MPFQKGNQLAKGYGRKGFEEEEKELKRMRAILDKSLILIEKMQTGKNVKPKEAMAFVDYRPVLMKIMDKIHPSKQDVKLETEKPLLIKTNGDKI